MQTMKLVHHFNRGENNSIIKSNNEAWVGETLQKSRRCERGIDTDEVKLPDLAESSESDDRLEMLHPGSLEDVELDRSASPSPSSSSLRVRNHRSIIDCSNHPVTNYTLCHADDADAANDVIREEDGESRNDQPPPIDEIFIHHLPAQRISVYQKRRPTLETRRSRRSGMNAARDCRSMNDLQPTLSSHKSLTSATASTHSTTSSSTTTTRNGRLNRSISEKGVDVYSGASLASSISREAYSTFATYDSKTNTAYITISPGVKARIRGAKETHDCVKMDFYVTTSCYDCGLQIYCIADASYVLCPQCMTVSPIEIRKRRRDGGVGIGFTHADLCQWQE